MSENRMERLENRDDGAVPAQKDVGRELTVSKTLEACATCCENSAMMLAICDADNPKLSNLNVKQAELLRECARMLRELAGA